MNSPFPLKVKKIAHYSVVSNFRRLKQNRTKLECLELKKILFFMSW